MAYLPVWCLNLASLLVPIGIYNKLINYNTYTNVSSKTNQYKADLS